jgi:hypothetical protein
MRYLFFFLLLIFPIVHVSTQDVVYEFTITSGAKVALNADEIRVATQTSVGCDIVYSTGFDQRNIRTLNTLNQLQTAMCGLGIPVQVVISGVVTSAIINQSFVDEIVKRTDGQGSIIMKNSKSVYDTRLPYQSVVNLFKNCANAGGSSFTGVSTGPSIAGNGLLASPLALAPQGATNGQVLKYNGTAWVPAADATGGTVVTNTTLSGDGTVGNPLKLAQQGAINGQVMRWIGGEWVPSTLPTSVTTVGPSTATPSANGATITGSTINLAKANASNAGLVQLAGDFGGTATAPRVTGLQGRPISATTPTNGQVYVYNASLGRWEPGTVSGGGGGGGSTDLAVDNRTSTTLDILSSSGMATTLPFATNLLAGLQIAADKAKSDFVTVTQAVDLDALETASHAAVTKTGQNYITLSGQAITVNAVDVSGGDITGLLKSASFPALTGAVTNTAGTLATTLSPNVVGTANIIDNTILFGDIAQNGATTNQIPTWNGSAWAASTPVQEVNGLNSISELSALVAARSEQVAFVKDSLRGGTFVLKSAAGNTVDNGIVFPSAIAGKVWVRQYDGLRSALWYGIKKDGVTDNTSLYVTVLASLPASSTLYFPPGSYKGDIVLDGSVAIRGEGLATVLVSTTTGNAITLTNHPNELGKLVISGFKLVGYNGIVFSTPVANKWQFRDIDIQVSNIGVKKEHGNIYNTYENLSIYGGQYGLWAVNSPIQVMHTGGDLWLKCRFVNSAKAGVYINDQSFGSGSLVFQQCFFEGNFGFGVFVKQFGAGLVVSAPSLRFVDCWNEANFVVPSVVIDGVTYDSLNTVKVSKAVAVFDGSPCALDARNYGFVTFQNLKTDGIENYIRIDSTSFVQYKNCGLSRTNEGNVLFDGLTAFETGNQNSAQIPSRKLKVNHPKTIKTIDFSNTSPIVPGTTISGGVLFDKCQRYTLTGGTSIINLIPIVSGRIGIWTMDIRNKSNATNFQLVSTLSLGTVALANDTLWHTYAGIQVNPSTGNAGINLPAGSGTIDLSAFQYLEFTDMKEAIEYWNSEKYATGKPVEVSGGTGTQDYVTRFTTSNTIGDSQIRDNGTAVGVGIAPNNTFKLGVNGQTLQTATNPYHLIQNGGSNFFLSGSSANITGGGANDFDAFLYGNNTYNILTNGIKRFTLKGDGSIGLNTASPQSLGIQLQGLNSISLPATSGTAQNGLITRFSTPSTSAVLDLGSNGGGGFWFQSTDNSALNAAYPFLFNPNGGNVGINTSSAVRSLHVNGTARISGSAGVGEFVTLRDANGDISNATLGSGLSISGGVLNTTTSGTIIGGGTSSQMTYFNGVSSIAGSNRFTINNSSLAGFIINGGNGSGGDGSYIQFQKDGVNNFIFGAESSLFGGTGAGGAIFQYGDNPFFFCTNGSKRSVLLGNGNFGINTMSPSEKLDVDGNIKASSLAGTGNRLTQANSAGVLQPTTLDPSALATVSQPNQQITFGTGAGITSSSVLKYYNNTLDLLGRIELSDANQNTNIGLAAGGSSGGNTTINLGYVAGQFDTSVYSINIGALAGRFNKGTKLIAIGLNAGRDNTGLSTIAIGENSLAKNRGLENIAIGAYALGENTTGLRNTVIGTNAGSLNTTGENNTYVGWRAGYGQNGIGNTYVGESVNDQSYGGDDNSALGLQAQHDNYNSDRNNSLGALTLYTLQTVYAADMVTGTTYEIGFPGTTDWTLLGAANNLSRTVFTYNGVTPSGNGNVRNITKKSNGNIGIGHHAGYFVGRGDRSIYIGDKSGENTYFWHLSDILHIQNSNRDTSLIAGNFAQNRVGINKKVKDLAYNFEVNGTVSLQNLTAKNGTHTQTLFQSPSTGELAFGTGANFGLAAGSVAFGDGSNITEDNTNFKWDNTNKRLGIANPLSISDPVSVNGAISNNFRYLYRNPSTNAIIGEFGAGNNFNNGAVSDIGFRSTGNLLFGGTGTVNSALFITNGGNVGVGDITNPTYPLQLKKSAFSTRMSIWADNASGDATTPNLPGIEFQGSYGFVYGGITGVDRSVNLLEGGVSIFADPDVTAPTRTSRFFVNGLSGNVRIGDGITTTQSEKLLVVGTIGSTTLTSGGDRLVFANSSGTIDESSLNPARIITSDSSALGDVTGLFSNLQLGADVVTSTEIATGAVGSTEIASSAVTASKIGSGAVTETKIANGAVTGLKMTVGGETAQDILTYINGTIGYVGRQLDYLATGDVGGTFGSPTIKQFGATTGDIMTWNGSAWRPAAPSGGGGVPSGTANQTLYYNGTTLTASNQIDNDGASVGIGGAAAVDELTVYGTTKSIGALKVEGTGLNAGVWITNTTPTTGVTWLQLQDNTGFLYFQENVTGNIPLEIRKDIVTVTNINVKDAIYTQVSNGSGSATYQVTGLKSLIDLTNEATLATINLPEIVTGTPGANQVNKNFTLTLVIKSPLAVTMNRAGSDTFIQHGTTGSYTSFPIAADTTAVLQLIALQDNLWSIK